MKLNRDTLGSIPLQRASGAAQLTISRTQHLPTEEQIVGIGAAFKLLAEVKGINVPDLMAMLDNYMKHADGIRAEFKAVRQYIEEEL